MLEATRPGDIITDTFHSRRESILGENGKVIPEALDAASRNLTDAGWDKPKVTVEADQYLTAAEVIKDGKVVS